MPRVVILVGYHKPEQLLRGGCFIPVHLGRALAHSSFATGSLTRENYFWMLDNLIGDDTGENISALNKEFCELTAIYWAWKNYEQLGNPDYIGFMHYRRHFFSNPDWEKDFDGRPDNIIFPEITDEYLHNMHWNEVEGEIKKHDVILPHLFSMQKTFGQEYPTIGSFYNIPEKAYYNFDLLCKVLIEMYPEYESTIDEYYSESKIYFKNMFILRKNVFFEFCDFTFNVLFEYHRRLHEKPLPPQKIRDVAHVAEILYGLFFYKKYIKDKRNVKFLPISYIAEAPSCKILVSYHKKDFLIKNNIFVPIHSGRRIAFKRSKDGVLPESEYRWLMENMIGDDTGENISAENRKYGEVSSIYWAWKNYEKLGNPDYIGFTHYRRLFVFRPGDYGKDFRIILPSISENDVNKYMNQKDIYKAICQNDICMVKPSVFPQTLSEHYKEVHDVQDLDYVLEYIRHNYPEYYSDAKEHFSGHRHIFGNMWVMKKEIFFEYCDFLFKILEAMDHNLNHEHYSSYNMRYCGFMSERLTGIFILHKIHSKLKVKEYTTMLIKNTSLPQEIYPAYELNNIPIFCSSDDNYAPYCATLIKSIIENGSPKNNYDMVILEESLSDNNKENLKALEKGYSNLSVRFYNVRDLMQGHQFYLTAHFRIATYYRLFVSSIFRHYDKIIYLDVDTICLSDLADLYNEPLDGKLLAAVQDYGVIAKIKTGRCEPVEYFRDKVGVKDPFTEYFQAGVLLFNVAEFRKQNLEGDLIEMASKNKFAYVDQDVLNKICYGQVKLVDSSWNTATLSGSRKKIWDLLPAKLFEKCMSDRNKPRIIHYASFEKPWAKPEMDMAFYWWQYARLTPFYEKIISTNLISQKTKEIEKVKEIVRVDSVPPAILKDALKYDKILLRYYRYKFLSKITWGNSRKHYKEKKRAYKERIRAVRRFVKQGG